VVSHRRGWWQGSDGRWHPPDRGPHATTDELPVVPGPVDRSAPLPTEVMTAVPARARHLALARDTARHARVQDHRAPTAGPLDLPHWIKLVVAALVAVIVVSAAGVYVAARRSADGQLGRASDELGAPAGSPAVGSPVSTAPTTPPTAPRAPSGQAVQPDTPVTTTAPASPSASTTSPLGANPDPSAPPASGDPLAACSADQRSMIERGNYSWDWYLARFDENGDGILCT